MTGNCKTFQEEVTVSNERQNPSTRKDQNLSSSARTRQTRDVHVEDASLLPWLQFTCYSYNRPVFGSIVFEASFLQNSTHSCACRKRLAFPAACSWSRVCPAFQSCCTSLRFPMAWDTTMTSSDVTAPATGRSSSYICWQIRSSDFEVTFEQTEQARHSNYPKTHQICSRMQPMNLMVSRSCLVLCRTLLCHPHRAAA